MKKKNYWGMAGITVGICTILISGWVGIQFASKIIKE